MCGGWRGRARGILCHRVGILRGVLARPIFGLLHGCLYVIPRLTSLLGVGAGWNEFEVGVEIF